MFKKLMCTLIIFTIILAFGMTAFADPTDSPLVTPTPQVTPLVAPLVTTQVEAEAVIKEEADSTDILDPDVLDVIKDVTEDTEQFLVTITRPDEETDSTYKSSYVISGVSDSSDVKVVLEVYNKESEEYVLMENTDGESVWDIGSYNVFSKAAFSKEIELEEGPNQIRILAFRTAQADGLKVEDVQVNEFTITLLKESIKDKVIKSFVDFTKLFVK